jgi:hypothetical protein
MRMEHSFPKAGEKKAKGQKELERERDELQKRISAGPKASFSKREVDAYLKDEERLTSLENEIKMKKAASADKGMEYGKQKAKEMKELIGDKRSRKSGKTETADASTKTNTASVKNAETNPQMSAEDLELRKKEIYQEGSGHVEEHVGEGQFEYRITPEAGKPTADNSIDVSKPSPDLAGAASKNPEGASAGHLGEEISEAPGPGENRSQLDDKKIEDAWKSKVGEIEKPDKESTVTARFIDVIPKTSEEIDKKSEVTAEAHLGDVIPEAPGPGENRAQLDDKKIEDAWREKVGEGEGGEKPLPNEAEMAKIQMEALVENAKRDKNSAREAYVASDYKTSGVLTRLKRFFGRNMQTGTEGVADTHGLYEIYRTKSEEYKNLRVQELTEKYKEMTPEELAANRSEMDKELGVLVTEFNLSEKTELYNARREAMVKEREGTISGKALEVGNNLINKYRKLGFKKQMLFSAALLGGGVACAATGAVFLAGGISAIALGRRIIGGASAGLATINLQEAGRRGLEKRRSEKDKAATMEDLGNIEDLDAKFEALSGKLQSEIDTFKTSLDTEKRKSINRRIIGAGVGVFVGSGLAGQLMKDGFNWAGNTGAGKYVADQYHNASKFAGGQMDSIKNSQFAQKASGAAGGFGKHFAAGLGGGEAGGGIASEYGKGVAPSHGADVVYPGSNPNLPPEVSPGVVPSHGEGVVYPKSGEHILPVGVVSNIEMEQSLGSGGIASEYGKGVAPSHGADVVYPGSNPNLPPEVSPGVVPSHGEGIVYPESRPSGGMTQFEQDVRQSDLAKGSRPDSGMTQFEKDARAGAGARQGFEKGRMGGWDPDPKEDFSHGRYGGYDPEPTVESPVKPLGPEIKPVGVVSNIGMEQSQKISGIETATKGDNVWNMIERQSHVRLGADFDGLSEAQKHNIIATLRNDMIKNMATDPEHSNYGFKLTKAEITQIGKLNADPAKQMRFIDHIISTKLQAGQKIDFSNLYQDRPRVSSIVEGAQNLKASQIAEINAHDKAIADWAKAHPNQHLDMQRTDEIINGKGSGAGTGTAEHLKGAKVAVPEQKMPEYIPEVKEIHLSGVSQHLEGVRDIEAEANAIVARQAEAQNALARLEKQIAYDKNNLKLGDRYPGKITSGPTLKESMEGRMHSRDVLTREMQSNDSRLSQLKQAYVEKFGNAAKTILTSQGEDISQENASKYIRTHKTGSFGQFYNECSDVLKDSNVRPKRGETMDSWTQRIVTQMAREQVK